ncbi:protein BTG3 isoform X2 [Clupea harengus]|uniref:Protein BTG3 isoform X2 n=1 Tax=Clupea harengus TaxID=7950 RepID=A0A6P8FZ92_CLUHA|nr:protein BTG3 isoform X2 [Clupea harengus]
MSRCIRVNGHHKKDADLLLACQESGVQYCYLGLPIELTLWVDPGEVSCRYSEDTPPFTLARFIGDDDNENVLLKVRSALERVTSDYHSETSSDDDGVCISPPPENDSAFTTPPPERDSGYGTASPKNIFCARPSPDNNSISATSSPPNRRGGATTPPQNRSPPMQVDYPGPQPLAALSWRIPVRSPVEPRPYFMLNPRVRPFPPVRPHSWSRPVYRNPMWSCPARSHRGGTAAIWSSPGNERRFAGRMHLNRPLK